MRNTLLISASLLTFVLAGCSSIEGAERKPFADKVPFIAFQPVTREVQSIGTIELKDCQHFLFQLFALNDPPTFEGIKDKMVQDKQIVYMTDVTTARRSQNFGAWKQKCIYLKGVAYR